MPETSDRNTPQHTNTNQARKYKRSARACRAQVPVKRKPHTGFRICATQRCVLNDLLSLYCQPR
eukprot:3258109-Lingulodinium_polyedra.AAC.1